MPLSGLKLRQKRGAVEILRTPGKLDELRPLEASVEKHVFRRTGVRRRLFFLFLPLCVLSLLGLELGIGIPTTLLFSGAASIDHLIHSRRLKAAERERG